MFKTEEYSQGEIIRWAWARESELIPEPFWTSTYFVDGILIDSCSPAGLSDFRQFIKSADLEKDIEKVILTHWHEDHSGGAGYLSEELGLPVYIHENGLKKVRNGFSLPSYRELAWGDSLEPAPNVQALDFNSIETSTRKYTLELLHIPGHSSDLIALIEPRKEWIFVSDSLVPDYQMIFNETREDLEPGMEPVNEDMEKIYSSLKKIKNYTNDMENPSVYTAAFGKFGDQNIIDKNIREIESLHEKVHDYKEKGLSPTEIVDELFGEEHLIGEMTDHALSRLNLVNSLMEWPLPGENN